MPKVSVIMPAYNAEKFLRQAMDSVLSQTYSNLELIVINDCSVDSTESIILSYEDKRVVYLKNEKNLGVAATLNKGLETAKGQYIARMDADDICVPERLSIQLEYMDQNPDVIVCGSNFIPFDEKGDMVVCCYPETDEAIRTAMLFGCPFAHPSVMIRAGALKKLGLKYEVAFEKVEDYRFWTQLQKHGKLYNIQQPLLRYRRHSGQITAISGALQLEGKYRIASQLLSQVGIFEQKDIKTVVDAFDGCPKDKKEFQKFQLLAVRMKTAVQKPLDERQLGLTLKSRLIELALDGGYALSTRVIKLVGMKAWMYVNFKSMRG